MKTRFLALPLALAGVVFGQSSTTSSTNRPDPAERMERMLTRFLQLDSGQQNQVHTILQESQVANKGLAEQLPALRKSLTAAIKANDVPQIESLSQQISGIEQQLSTNRAKTAAKIYAILNDSQRGVVGEGLGMLMGGGPMGPGGFGGPGPGGRRGPPPAPKQ